jgi:molecular chaperone DnaK (HSP70)
MNIGIDLGTTNSALAYIEEIHGELPDYPEIQVLAIPQYVAPGQIEARRTLPSFLVPGRSNLRRRLRARAGRAGAHQVGAFGQIVAVESGSGSHRQDPAVGRAGGRPRAVAGGRFHGDFVRTIRDAWNQTHPNAPLASQDVVLTVPASFDEEARELTVQAAHAAESKS